MEAIKTDISINADDMYRFQMYHTYHTGQGILTIVLGIISIVVGIVTPITVPDRVEPIDIIFYIAAGLVFLGYYPVSLKRKAPMQVENSPILSHPLHYIFDEKGITVVADETAGLSEDENTAVLPWEKVFKAVITKDQLLIYSNKVNAYILPLSQVSDISGIKKLMTEKLPSHRIAFK